MSVEAVGKVLIVGLPGPELDAAHGAMLSRLAPAGVILFARNLVDVEQTRRLVDALRAATPPTLLFVDAEGGRVDRLKKLVGPAPPAATLAHRPPRASRRAGAWVGAALRHFDLDVDLAPVVDLDHGAVDNALDGRYLGRTPRAVLARGRAFIAGLHAAGVGACVKHFPGLGPVRVDTHRAMAVVDSSERELARDLLPFERLSGEAGAVLVAHAIYPALDPSGLPATLSPAIATDRLRRRLRFRGVTICDDLEMGALAEWGGIEERAARALAAGCDLLPVCSRIDEVPGVARRLRAPALRRRLAEAGARFERYRRAVARRKAAAPRFTLDRIRLGVAEAAAIDPNRDSNR